MSFFSRPSMWLLLLDGNSTRGYGASAAGGQRERSLPSVPFSLATLVPCRGDDRRMTSQWGLTVPLSGIPLADHAGFRGAAGRVHGPVVQRGGRHGRVHAAGAGRRLVAGVAAGHRGHPGLHPGTGAAGDERGDPGRGRAGAVALGHRGVVAGAGAGLERGRSSSRSSGPGTCCGSYGRRCAARLVDEVVRHVHRPTVPVWSDRQPYRRRSCSARCVRGCCGWPPPRPTVPCSTGSPSTT